MSSTYSHIKGNKIAHYLPTKKRADHYLVRQWPTPPEKKGTCCRLSRSCGLSFRSCHLCAKLFSVKHFFPSFLFTCVYASSLYIVCFVLPMHKCKKTIKNHLIFFGYVVSYKSIQSRGCGHGSCCLCRCSSSVEHQLPKLGRRVRFPSSAL